MPGKILSDDEIVERIIQGEKSLYELLMRKYNQRMYRIAMSIVNDDMGAEDIMQAAYLNAFMQLPAFKHKAGFGTWLTRILINESLLYRKKDLRRREVLAGVDEDPEDQVTPLKSLMNKELKAILEKAVFQLPEKYRLVFVMREIEEMSTSETMEVLNLGESNIKIRLSRAKQMLRQELSSYYKPKELFDFHLSRCDRVVLAVMDTISREPFFNDSFPESTSSFK
ncbi:RNA polymerase sigma factor [Flavihumibacter sp. R14]|nr:RNA polymerase sigma factor [Flavihumibacter soli]